MQRPTRQQLIALIGTIAFHLLLLIGLVTLYLRYDPVAEAEREWPPVDSAEILFGGEYVALGDIADAQPTPQPAVEESPAPPEAIIDPAPPTPPHSNTTSSRQESPAKVPTPKAETPKPEKPVVDPAAQERERQQKATAQATDSRVAGAFASSSSASTKSGGSPNGNAASGNTSGQPGVNLGGRTLASWTKARANAIGTITIDVTVNRQGRVVAASYNPGLSSGAAAASPDARQSCIAAAKQCTFSVAKEDSPETQRGTISFNFR
ncbi:MAG: hypothetical protein J1E63_04920 [Muribaculaceae bacterium]|nr:hypothetical protein [Muribaculaceae bacterium]